MLLNQFLVLAAVLFCIGVYGVLSRRNGVMVLMSIELILNAVNINLVAFSAYLQDVTGQVFSLFIIAVAAAEVGVGLALVLMLYRNRTSIDLDEIDLLGLRDRRSKQRQQHRDTTRAKPALHGILRMGW